MIDGDDDTISPLSSNLDNDNGLLSLGHRKRKRVFELDEEAGNEFNEARIEGQVANISFENLLMDEGTNNLDGDDATSGVHSTIAAVGIIPSLSNQKSDDDLPKGSDLLDMSFSQVVKILKAQICDPGLPREGQLGMAAILATISTLEIKHSPKKVVKSTRPHPQPGDEIKWLVRGLGKDPDYNERGRNMAEVLEEDRHPWNISRKKSDEIVLVQDSSPAPKIYMRIWDDKSQAGIREGNEGFLSGSNYMPLDTKEQRKTAIKNHANWGNRWKTAFTSTTLPHLYFVPLKRGK